MSPKLRPRNRLSQRPAVRTILVAGTASCILLGVIGSVIWQSFRDEDATAGLPRIISSVQTQVSSTAVFKGTFRQPLLRLNIETSGEGKAPVLQKIDFSLAGTSTELLQSLEPSGIFTTTTTQFNDDQQLKLTQIIHNEKKLSVELMHALQPGSNYIWITFNIRGENLSGEGKVSILCNQISIGNLTYEPVHTSLATKTTILPHTVWFSKTSGDISDLSTWNSKRDGSGTSAQSFSNDEQVFFIQSGSVLSNKVNACISNLVIERGGTLQSSTGLKADSTIIESRGIWNQIAPFKDKNSIRNFIIRGGGNYLHNNNGSIPGQNKSIEEGSLVLLKDLSGLDSTDDEWGNLIIDLGEKQQVMPSALLKYIKGTLECKSGIIKLSGSGTIYISSDLLFTGGTLLSSNPGDSVHIKALRNVKVNSGGIASGKNTVLIIAIGNTLNINNGFVDLNNKSWIFPGGNLSKPFKWKQTGGVVKLGNIILEPGTVMVAEGQLIGPLSQGSDFIIKHDARLDLGNAVVTGSGTFQLDKDAIMATSIETGIWSKGNTGCIQTSVRIFSSEGGFIYSSPDALQRTGIFTTVPDREKVGVLRFFKNNPSQKIILERNFKVTKNYSLIRGSLDENGFKIYPEYELANEGISSR